ncbi:fasciclin domain-containing protein [Roseobacter sp. HKCCA0434]|uniref:fasciclin domain-containing protein n=1 Tax=Roseobacter sp. HKCCA0434 TaxID=3079297 RepID=UPI00290597B0|nr:fasciclin domain-containing protein [Roseobacter sp. HKCCA0434]
MKRTLWTSALVGALTLMPALATAQDMTPDAIDLVEVASGSGQFDTLIEALMAADLGETVATTEGLTIFAPIDEVFVAIDDLDAILADPERLTAILQLHVVPSVVMSDALASGMSEIETLGGGMLTIGEQHGQVSIVSPSGAEAMIVRADIEADNGVIHAIETVLTP